eukprot:5304831-Pyramimonas_sp.AAC.1
MCRRRPSRCAVQHCRLHDHVKDLQAIPQRVHVAGELLLVHHKFPPAQCNYVVRFRVAGLVKSELAPEVLDAAGKGKNLDPHTIHVHFQGRRSSSRNKVAEHLPQMCMCDAARKTPSGKRNLDSKMYAA